jgi:hypothetical protein
MKQIMSILVVALTTSSVPACDNKIPEDEADFLAIFTLDTLVGSDYANGLAYTTAATDGNSVLVHSDGGLSAQASLPFDWMLTTLTYGGGSGGVSINGGTPVTDACTDETITLERYLLGGRSPAASWSTVPSPAFACERDSHRPRARRRPHGANLR